MAKLDPTVQKETVYIAVWVFVLSLVMEAVFLVTGYWTPAVLTGNLVGAATAIGNYLLLGIMVSRAVSGPADKVAMRVRASKTARQLGQAGICALAIGLLHTNVYATVIPLFFPRIGIAFRPLVDRRRGKSQGSEEGSDLLD